MTRAFLPTAAALLICTLGACGSPPQDSTEAGHGGFSSNHANVLDFAFRGEVIASTQLSARTAIVSQLAYVEGLLTTAEGGNGNVGQVRLDDIVETPSGDGKKTITYAATLPVAWPKDSGNPVPETYDLPLPKDLTDLDTFNEKYDGKCGNAEYGTSNFWHDWNPKAGGCRIDNADVTRSKATVRPSANETTGKYPEYDLMWKDNELDVVAVFGLIDSTSYSDSDSGVAEYTRFIQGTRNNVRGAVAENDPSDSILRDTTITGKVMVGGQERPIKVDVLLVSELASVGRDFDERYDPLSEKADVIMYDGHAGLGRNINALARKGKVTAGKYQLVLLNGCQTFAYIDTTINDRRIEANGAASDPKGTKFLDLIGNALPGHTSNLADMSLTVLSAVTQPDSPKTFNDLMTAMPRAHLVVTFGEEDNAFRQ